VRAIRERELYVFTHMYTRDWLLARHRRIADAFADCERWQMAQTGRDGDNEGPEGSNDGSASEMPP
jgi:hypothetical protein